MMGTARILAKRAARKFAYKLVEYFYISPRVVGLNINMDCTTHCVQGPLILILGIFPFYIFLLNFDFLNSGFGGRGRWFPSPFA
jgi:hypothetical protein